MKSLRSTLLAALPLLSLTTAQDEGINYTDRASGITFNTWPLPGLTFGMTLPANGLTTDATEFLGLLTCSTKTAGAGWCGLSLGGGMVNNLLLVAYPYNNQVLTSFKWATTYGPPVPYTGNAKLTQVSSTVNATHYSVIFRCQNCLSWNQNGEEGSAPTSVGFLVLGWALASASPTGAGCPDTISVRRHDSEGIFGAVLNPQAATSSYQAWAAKATATIAGSCGGGLVPQPPPVVTTAVTTLTPTRPTAAPPAAPGCAKSYTVVAGDYCWAIATGNGLSVEGLLAINPGLVCDPLRIGTVVCLKR
ncbi:hypothetical protein OQA88_8607 [Cercophora sp. LCS_1]